MASKMPGVKQFQRMMSVDSTSKVRSTPKLNSPPVRSERFSSFLSNSPAFEKNLTKLFDQKPPEQRREFEYKKSKFLTQMEITMFTKQTVERFNIKWMMEQEVEEESESDEEENLSPSADLAEIEISEMEIQDRGFEAWEAQMPGFLRQNKLKVDTDALFGLAPEDGDMMARVREGSTLADQYQNSLARDGYVRDVTRGEESGRRVIRERIAAFPSRNEEESETAYQKRRDEAIYKDVAMSMSKTRTDAMVRARENTAPQTTQRLQDLRDMEQKNGRKPAKARAARTPESYYDMYGSWEEVFEKSCEESSQADLINGIMPRNLK